MFHLLLALLTKSVFGAEVKQNSNGVWCEDVRLVAMTWNFHSENNNVEQDVIEATIGSVQDQITCKPQVFALSLQEFPNSDVSDNFDKFMKSKGYQVAEAYKHDKKGKLKDDKKKRCFGSWVPSGNELRHLCLLVYGQPNFIMSAEWDKSIGKQKKGLGGKGYIVTTLKTKSGAFNLAGLHFPSGINNFDERRKKFQTMITKPLEQFNNLVLKDAATVIMGDWNTRYHFFGGIPWSMGKKSGSEEWDEAKEDEMKKVPNDEFIEQADMKMKPAWDEMKIFFADPIASQTDYGDLMKSKELREAFALNLKQKWDEPEVPFRPTHKIKPNGNGGAQYYQKEPPSWTDRIICTKTFKTNLFLEDQTYNSVEGTLKTSDHYPVFRVWKVVQPDQKSDDSSKKANTILGRIETKISAEKIDSKSLSKLPLEYIFSPGGVFLVILLVGIATKHLCCRKRNEFDRKIEQPLLV